MASASEIEADLIRQGVDPSVARQESGYLADTYGAVPSGAVESYIQRSTNLVDNWDRPTASAGGTGGDIDLDGDSHVDSGWYVVDSPDTGNPGWVQAADLGKLSGDVAAFDASGAAASDVVAAYFQAEKFFNSATAAAGQEIDRLNLTGVFDDGNGQSAAGVAAARASIGKQIFDAQRAGFGSLLGAAPRVQQLPPGIARPSTPGVSGPTGGTLLPPGPLRRVTNPPLLNSPDAGGAPGGGGELSSSPLLPAGPLRRVTGSGAPAAAAGGAPGADAEASSPLVPIGLALAALKLFGVFH